MKSPLARGQLARPGGAAVSPAAEETPTLLTRLRREALRSFAASPFYRHTLIGRVPSDLRLRVGERWPGDAKRGATILSGEILLAGQIVRNPMPVWFPPEAGSNWLAAWHDFSWVADVLSVGGGAKDAVRALVQSWLSDNTSWHPVAWRADVLATRIYTWLVHFDEIASREADRLLRRAMLVSLVVVGCLGLQSSLDDLSAHRQASDRHMAKRDAAIAAHADRRMQLMRLAAQGEELRTRSRAICGL